MQRPDRHPHPDIPLHATGAAAEMLPLEALETAGWIVLRDCPIGGPPGPPPRIPLVLLHPEIGVALLETGPGSTPRAEALLRQRLEAARFQGIFSGHLPILHRQVPLAELPRLERILAEGFAALPPLTMPGGDAWVSVVRRALSPRDPARSGAPLGAMPDPSPWAAPPPPAAAAAAFEPDHDPLRRPMLNRLATTRPQAPPPEGGGYEAPEALADADAAAPAWWRRPWPWVGVGLAAVALAGTVAVLEEGQRIAPQLPPRPAPETTAPARPAPLPPLASPGRDLARPSPPPAPAPAATATGRDAPGAPAASAPRAGPPAVTPPPTPQPAPETVRVETTVTRARVNLRTGPSDRATVLRVLPRGQSFRVLDRAPGGWVQVGDPEPIGWVHSSLLEEGGSP